MKKLLWVLILLLLPLTALAEDAESRRDGAFFYQIADGEAVLTGCDWDAMQADSLYMFAEPQVSLEIPAELGGVPVVAIAANALNTSESCADSLLFGIVLPEGVQRVEADAFQCCHAATQISFPSTLTMLAEGSFFSRLRGNRLPERQPALFLRKRLPD